MLLPDIHFYIIYTILSQPFLLLTKHYVKEAFFIAIWIQIITDEFRLTGVVEGIPPSDIPESLESNAPLVFLKELIPPSLKEQAKTMSREEKMDLLELLHRELGHEQKTTTRRITELKGLGSNIWHGVDAVEYIRGERDSWDG